MNICEIKDEYIKCCEICSKTKYEDKSSVRAHNAAVKKMSRLVEIAITQYSSMRELAELLDNPISAKWIAHDLVEKVNTDPYVQNKCLEIIRSLGKGDSLEAMGERMWLDEWEKKSSKGTSI